MDILFDKGLTFTGHYFTGRVEILSINQESNELKVNCTQQYGDKFSQWGEIWDLKCTIMGFQQGEYFIKYHFPGFPAIENNFPENEKHFVSPEKHFISPEKHFTAPENELKHVKNIAVIGHVEHGGPLLCKAASLFKSNNVHIIDVPEPYLITKAPIIPEYLLNLSKTHTLPVKRNGIKVGKNQLCPCGSGKKYKKCCINK